MVINNLKFRLSMQLIINAIIILRNAVKREVKTNLSLSLLLFIYVWLSKKELLANAKKIIDACNVAFFRNFFFLSFLLPFTFFQTLSWLLNQLNSTCVCKFAFFLSFAMFRNTTEIYFALFFGEIVFSSCFCYLL